MIISEDHILPEELNNLTRILPARAQSQHLIIKNKKSPHLHPQQLAISTDSTTQKQTFSPLLIPSQTYANHLQPRYIKTVTQLPMIKQRLLITRFLTWLLTYIYIDLNTTANTPTVSSLFSLSTNNSTQLIVLMLTTWNSGTCYEDQHIIQRQHDITTRSFSCKYLHLHQPWASTGT